MSGAIARARVLAVACLAGCGGGASDTPATFNPAYAEAFCGLAFRCCDPSERRNFGSSAAECERGKREELDKIAMLIGSGHIPFAFQPAAAHECLAQLEMISCLDISRTPSSPCRGVYLGYAGQGQTCFDDTWCASGLGCSFEIESSEAGVCRPLGGPGATCGLCRSDLWCDAASKTCQPPKADGARCMLDRECQSGDCVYPDLQSPGACGPRAPTCTGMPRDGGALDGGAPADAAPGDLASD
jgi:hypothetical protein